MDDTETWLRTCVCACVQYSAIDRWSIHSLFHAKFGSADWKLRWWLPPSSLSSEEEEHFSSFSLSLISSKHPVWIGMISSPSTSSFCLNGRECQWQFVLIVVTWLFSWGMSLVFRWYFWLSRAAHWGGRFPFLLPRGWLDSSPSLRRWRTSSEIRNRLVRRLLNGISVS